jgi:uncharacterized LabA/DUF88 family protein
MSTTQRPRAGIYVDGFNLYHALADLKQPYLKWLGLGRLANRLARAQGHQVERIVFCTAFFPGDEQKRKRHEVYNDAQRAERVDVLLGHTTREPMHCKVCTARWDAPREKETDINVALSIFRDAAAGLVDVVYLVSADTDQAATLRFLRAGFPAIRRVVVTPPGREKSKHLRDLADENRHLTVNDIDMCVMPAMVTPPNGRLITRPPDYEPPAGWVHPDNRP